jgi:hypothetical protein
LDFTLEVEGASCVFTFTKLAEALAFFTDDVLLLGHMREFISDEKILDLARRETGGSRAENLAIRKRAMGGVI